MRHAAFDSSGGGPHASTIAIVTATGIYFPTT
jgi:hypothetical protein